MSTFAELQKTVKKNADASAILMHLIEYIDSTFRPVAGGEPKSFLVTDDRVKIQPEAFEEIVSTFLLPQQQRLQQEAEQILSATIQVQQPTPPAPEQPEPPQDVTQPDQPQPITTPEGPGRSRRKAS